jgi:hypothetical protein
MDAFHDRVGLEQAQRTAAGVDHRAVVARADHEGARDEILDWAQGRYADLLDRLSR